MQSFHIRCECPSCSSGDSNSLSSGLAALAQPFKLRLARSEHEKQLKDYSSNVVLIEPLASMTAVEDFLWSKVYRSEHSPPPPARAASAADAGHVSFSQPCLVPVLLNTNMLSSQARSASAIVSSDADSRGLVNKAARVKFSSLLTSHLLQLFIMSWKAF